MAKKTVEKFRSKRDSKYPNVGTIHLDHMVTMEVHEYPIEIDGEEVDADGTPELEQTGSHEVVIRGWGYKVVLKLKK